jgi:hypothetical protein
MCTKVKPVLPATMVIGLIGLLSLLGGAVPALASDHNGQDKTYGGPVQTWCDVNPDCNGWSKGLHRASYESSAPGSVAPPTPKPHPRKHGHDAGKH